MHGWTLSLSLRCWLPVHPFAGWDKTTSSLTVALHVTTLFHASLPISCSGFDGLLNISDSDLPGFCQVNLPAHGWCSVLFLQFAWTVPVPWIACLIQIYLCRQRLGISLFSGHLWNYRQDTASHQSTPTNSWGTCIRFSCVLGWNTNLQPLTSVSNPVLALLQSQLIPKMGARSLRSCQMLFIILNKNKICISIILK